MKNDASADTDELMSKLDNDDMDRSQAVDRALGMSAADLPRVDHGESPRHPLADEQRWCVTLADGRVIVLERLHQYRVYAGLLAGAPQDVCFELDAALRRAQELFSWYRVAPLILPPTVRAGSIPPPEGSKGDLPWEVVPHVATVAEFKSGKPARDDDECYSSLVVVWFQEKFGLPDDERILGQLRNIDWKSRAWDWTP